MIDSSFKFAGIAGAMALAISASVVAQDPEQWRVEDGGNGHWYALDDIPRGWNEAMLAAATIGAHGATIHSDEENLFVYGLAELCCSAVWIGGVGADGACTDREQYNWVTGEMMSYSNWLPNEPNGWRGSSTCAIAFHPSYPGDPRWNDVPREGPWNGPTVIEWSADCNGDGIVDYGQIQDGTFADANGNGVPDCCDAGTACDPCLGDLTDNGVVDAADLGILLAVWNTDGKTIPAADINGDGTVNAADLGILLGAWGPCP